MHFSAALGYLDVRVVDTDYSSYAVVYIYKELQGALSTMVQLYSEARAPGSAPAPLSPRPRPFGTCRAWLHPLPSLGPARIRWGRVGAALCMGSG